MGIDGQLASLAAVVVGVEHEPVLPPRLEEHHPHRRAAVPIDGGHRHRLGVRHHGGGVVEPAPELDQRIGIGVTLEKRFEGLGHPPDPTGVRHPAPVGRGSAGRFVRRDRRHRRRGRAGGHARLPTVAHLNNAGAALPTGATVDAMVEHLRLESERGGYEAAAMVADRLSALRSSAARLIGAGDGEVVMTGSDTQGWTKALWGFALGGGIAPGQRLWPTGSPTTATTSGCSRYAS